MIELNTSMKGNCILCAEDNSVNQIVLEHTLNEQELPAIIVNNGKEAVVGWQLLDPKIIIMDISMPVMNGIEAIQKIREEEEGTGKRVPIIVLTAHALTGDEERSLDAGADYYLTKPINPNMLLAKLMEISGEGPKLAVCE